MNPEDLLAYTKEELIRKLEELNIENDQRMAELVMIRSEIMFRLKKEKKDGELIGEYSVMIAKRLTFETTIEQAGELGAVKPSVDTNILRKIYSKGVKVPGAKITEYLSVRRLSQEEGENA